MTDLELRNGMLREMAMNVIKAPVVLTIRLPLGLLYASLDAITDFLDWANGWLPGWRNDYFKAWRANHG